MRVFVNGRQVVVESNVEWALVFWTERKLMREKDGVRITWEFL
jgi:hypothetical protein